MNSRRIYRRPLLLTRVTLEDFSELIPEINAAGRPIELLSAEEQDA